MGNLKLGDWVEEVPGYNPEIGDTGSALIIDTTYQTLIMPDGREWLSENFRWSGAGALYTGDLSGDVYGRLYNYAVDGSAVEDALPTGWRWPSEDDYVTLFAALGASWVTDRWAFIGREMKESGTAYWAAGNTGTNTSGFGLRGAGRIGSGTSTARTFNADMVTSTVVFTTALREVTFQFKSTGAPYEDAARRTLNNPVSALKGSLRLVRDVVPTPPSYRSGTHDLLVLPNGQAETTYSLAQRVDVRLRTFLGEHWLNPELGVPWFRDFLTKAPDLAVCRQVLWDTILGVRGVRAINRLDLAINKATRVLTVTFAVNGTDSFTSTITV